MMKQRPCKISVIVPSRHRDANLAALLPALGRQTLDDAVSLEVVVALDGGVASRETAGIAARSAVTVQLLELPHVGISEAKNRAVSAATGEILLFLNDDVVPNEDFVTRHLDGLQQCGFRHMVLGHTAWADHAEATVMDLLVRSTGIIFFYNNMQAGRLYDFRHAWNCNLSVTREIFEKAGGFSEELRPCMYEDIEAAWRMEDAGSSVLYQPSAHAAHNHRYTFESYLKREILLGMMAPVLWQVNPGCFMSIYRCNLDELVAAARHAAGLDIPDFLKTYRFLKATLSAPAQDEPSGMLQSLYFAHLTVKRRAFRFGLLKGMEDANSNGEWQNRASFGQCADLPDDIAGGRRTGEEK